MLIIQPYPNFNLSGIKSSSNISFGNSTINNNHIRPMGFDTVSFTGITHSDNEIISPQQIRAAVTRDENKPMISIEEINKELGTKFNAVCNPGVHQNKKKGSIEFLLRCIEKIDPNKAEAYPTGNFRSIGVYCESTDGKTLNTLPDGKKFKIVVIPYGKEGSNIPENSPGARFKFGFEDWRITEEPKKTKDPKKRGLLHLICTGYTGQYCRTCHFTTTDLSDPQKYKFAGIIGPKINKDCGLSPVLDKNGNYVLFDRPTHNTEHTLGSTACIVFRRWSDLSKKSFWKKEMSDQRVQERAILPSSGKGNWLQKSGLGGLPIPVKVDGKKYLVHLFHSSDPGKGNSAREYRMGVALSPIDDPTRICNLAPHWIAEPEHPYEKEGLVPNVIFPGGGYLAKNEEGKDIIRGYYGACDNSVGMFEVPVRDLVKFALQYDKTGKPTKSGAEPGIVIENTPHTPKKVYNAFFDDMRWD